MKDLKYWLGGAGLTVALVYLLEMMKPATLTETGIRFVSAAVFVGICLGVFRYAWKMLKTPEESVSK